MRRCDASTLAQDGVRVDLLGLAENLGGLHVFRDTPPRGRVRDLSMTPSASSYERAFAQFGCVAVVVAKKFLTTIRDRHHEIPEYERQRRRSRQPRVSSLKRANLARGRAARATASLARLPAWGNAAVGDTRHDARRGKVLAPQCALEKGARRGVRARDRHLEGSVRDRNAVKRRGALCEHSASAPSASAARAAGAATQQPHVFQRF